MSLLSQSLLASTLTLLVAAQTSTVTNVFIPFADQQPLDASIIAQVSQKPSITKRLRSTHNHYLVDLY